MRTSDGMIDAKHLGILAVIYPCADRYTQWSTFQPDGSTSSRLNLVYSGSSSTNHIVGHRDAEYGIRFCCQTASCVFSDALTLASYRLQTAAIWLRNQHGLNSLLSTIAIVQITLLLWDQ